MAEKTHQDEIQKLRADDFKESSDCNENKKETSHRYRILLEPALFGTLVAINMGQTSIQNLYLRTACTVDLNYPKNICDTGVGESFRIAEEESQSFVSEVNISRSFVSSVIATVVLLFVGPWSDCSGRRKPVIIFPLLGMCVMSTAALLLLTFPGASTVQTLYAIQIPINVAGNFGLLRAATFSHIGDVCHARGLDVTRVMGTHRAAIQMAQVIGSLSGPLLYRYLGFYGVFSISLLLQLSSLLYVVLYIKDVNVNSENKISVFNWRLPVNAVKCIVQERPQKKRTIILLMILVSLGDSVVLAAGFLIAYMFYRQKYNWDDVMFGSYLAYQNIVGFLGTLLILTVLKRAMRLSDECVGIFSCLSFIISTSGLMAAQSTIVVLILPIIGIISQGSIVVQRPLLNKQILPSEQGQIYSVMSALESATQIISSPLYSFVYSRSVSTYPDLWLVPGIILSFFQLAAYYWTKQIRKETTERKTVDIKNEEENSRIVIENSLVEKNIIVQDTRR